MIERNNSDCKYVEIFNHHVGGIGGIGGIGARSTTMIIRGTNIKH
jgi:hypothetical protein